MTTSSSSPTTPRPSICAVDDSSSHSHLDIISFPPAQTIRIVAELLENIIAQNDKLAPGVVTHFHSRSVPKIPIHAYLCRIQKFAPFSNEILITILVYFDRIARRQSSFVISSFNIHRLLITRLDLISLVLMFFHWFSLAVYPFVIKSDIYGQVPPRHVVGGWGGKRLYLNIPLCTLPALLTHSFCFHLYSLTVASKFVSDVFYANARYAKVRCNCNFGFVEYDWPCCNFYNPNLLSRNTNSTLIWIELV